MNIRCKFVVQSVKELNWHIEDGKFGQEIEMDAVHDSDSSNSENESFSKYTPSGTLKFMVSNPNVIGTIRPGQCYYIDLIKTN